MNGNITDETRARCQDAAVFLAVHFVEYGMAQQTGGETPLPENTEIEGEEQVVFALHVLAQELGLETERQRMLFVGLLAGLSHLISEQGAELEGMLHQIIHPDDNPRKAMVMRIRKP